MNIILFNKDEDLTSLSLSDYRAKHITDILKLKVNDTFKCGVVNESEGISKIISESSTSLNLSYTPLKSSSLNPLSLIIGQVRPICMQRILRDLSSLACSRLYLTGTDTGEKSYLSSSLYKTEQYQKFLLDGAMQGGHSLLPNVVFTNTVRELVKKEEFRGTDVYTHKILLDNKISDINNPPEKLSNLNFFSKTEDGLNKENIRVILAIGPERGWSDSEREYFKNSGFKACILGKQILRTETACVSVASITLSKMGLM